MSFPSLKDQQPPLILLYLNSASYKYYNITQHFCKVTIYISSIASRGQVELKNEHKFQAAWTPQK